MNKDLVSVIVPVKDREAEVINSVKSILDQSHRWIEIIVVENNSRCPSAIRTAIESLDDERVLFFSVQPCVNANMARNYGVRKSSGEYVAFLDSDDCYEQDHIESSLRLIKSKDKKFLYGASRVWDGENFYIKKARFITKGEHYLDYFFGSNRAFASTPTFLVHRSVFDDVMWDEQLYRHQDYDFFIACTSRYESVCKHEPSVIVNWKRGEARVYHSKSMRVFYKKWFGFAKKEHKRKYAASKIMLAKDNWDFFNVIYFLLVYMKCR